MNRVRNGLFIAVAVLLVTACSLAPVSDGALMQNRKAAGGSPVAHDGYVEVTGEIGPGALYSLILPDAWNGDLVLYAHGYVNPASPIEMPGSSSSERLIRDLLIANGYAVASSSYSENGWAIKDGITRTRQLKGLFRSNFGKPDQTYLIGSSMGGLIAVAIAEKHSQLVDGVLSLCGPVGGSSFQFEHLVHTRAVFDYFYPGFLPGDTYTIPSGLVWDDDLAMQLTLLLLSDPTGGAAKLASVSPPTIVWDMTDPFELVESILTALAFNIMGTQDVLDKTHGHIPVGNRDTVYASISPAVDVVDLNTTIDRFDSTPDAENVMEHWYQPTGALRVPVVTLHTERDPAVPYAHEAVFEDAVIAAGRGNLLVSLSTEAFGHCTFDAVDFLTAWQTLVAAVGP